MTTPIDLVPLLPLAEEEEDELTAADGDIDERGLPLVVVVSNVVDGMLILIKLFNSMLKSKQTEQLGFGCCMSVFVCVCVFRYAFVDKQPQEKGLKKEKKS